MSAVNVSSGGQPNQVVIGDLNGDGKPDLALADESGNGNVIVLFQDPANPARFLAPLNLPTGKVTAAHKAKLWAQQEALTAQVLIRGDALIPGSTP